MRRPTLEEEADEFLNVMTVVGRSEGRGRVVPEFQLLFAMRAAYWIRKEASSRLVLETMPVVEGLLNNGMNPDFELMYESYRRLLAAYRSSDDIALYSALQEMRILEFCPNLDVHFTKMAQLAQHGEGRVRLILHLELALFAFELGAESSVKHHVKEAWNLNPTGWERYILCTLQGFYEACPQHIHGAIHLLEDSITACFDDEMILIECGNRPPNLHLAQKLLSLGERIPVIDYLLACQDVWRLKQMPFAEWVRQIELGQEPDFETSEILRASNRTFDRLAFHSLSVYNPQNARLSGNSPYTKKSRREVLLAREKRLDESKRILNMIKRERTS
jgi:hypothetical protein